MDRPVPPETLVFVVAPEDVVLMFQTARELVSDLQRMEAQEREAASYYTLEGEQLDLVRTPAGGIWLELSGRDGSDALASAFRKLAGDNDPDPPTDPRLVANEVLESEWLLKWPTNPGWLRRVIRGRTAPTVDDR